MASQKVFDVIIPEQVEMPYFDRAYAGNMINQLNVRLEGEASHLYQSLMEEPVRDTIIRRRPLEAIAGVSTIIQSMKPVFLWHLLLLIKRQSSGSQGFLLNDYRANLAVVRGKDKVLRVLDIRWHFFQHAFHYWFITIYDTSSDQVWEPESRLFRCE
jgi:hypothetical protein